MIGVHVHPQTGSLLLQVDDPFAIRELVPESRTITLPDCNLAVRNTAENVRVLRNLGHAAPSKAVLGYRWPGKFQPMTRQLDMVDFHLTHARGFNLSEMGCGKTAAALWAADIMMMTGAVRKVLIVAPLSMLERVWLQEVFDVLMHRKAVVVHGSLEKRLKALETDVDFYILNHDGVSIGGVRQAVLRRRDIDLAIVDEGGLFRNASTDRYKALAKLLAAIPRVWWLTGTPVPNVPTDAWAQARIINPALVPQFFGTFKRQTMVQITQFKWAPRAGAEKIAFSALQPACRYMKRDCIDLPPVSTISLEAGLTPDQVSAFRTMKNSMLADLQSRQITAVNAADKIGKIRQILCGACRDTTDEYIVLPHEPRLKVLREAIDAASAKVIVIVPFKGIIRALEGELARHCTVGVLNGDVPIHTRNKIITDFKTTPDPHLLLCHPRVMAHGLNLTEADTLIFYAPIYSNDEFQQVIERFNRAGQKRKMTVVRIGAHPIEWQIYNMVDRRQITQENTLSLYSTIANS